jgi:hypothetical protein
MPKKRTLMFTVEVQSDAPIKIIREAALRMLMQTTVFEVRQVSKPQVSQAPREMKGTWG